MQLLIKSLSSLQALLRCCDCKVILSPNLLRWRKFSVRRLRGSESLLCQSGGYFCLVLGLFERRCAWRWNLARLESILSEDLTAISREPIVKPKPSTLRCLNLNLFCGFVPFRRFQRWIIFYGSHCTTKCCQILLLHFFLSRNLKPPHSRPCLALLEASRDGWMNPAMSRCGAAQDRSCLFSRPNFIRPDSDTPCSGPTTYEGDCK